MNNIKILNSRETKHLLEKLEEQFGCNISKDELDYAFLINKDNRIYIITKDVSRLDISELKIDAQGLYFGELYKDNIRLSIEGAQMIGPLANKNLVDLSYDQMIDWIKGNDLSFDENPGEGFVIVRYFNNKTDKFDYLGCGKFDHKKSSLTNYVSKSRRLIVVNN